MRPHRALVEPSSLPPDPAADSADAADDVPEVGARAAVARLSQGLRARGATLALAESCTGGLLAALLTDLPGSSDVFREGLVVYSNAAKSRRLGVDPALLEEFGAVSVEVALAMAAGLLDSSDADFVGAITGIAGPGGGSDLKPVGTVAFAVASRTAQRSDLLLLEGDRAAVRLAACAHLARMLLDALAASGDAAPPERHPG